MPTYSFTQVDAFTNQPLAGNSCAIVFGAHELSDETMLAVAREMNLSETSFLVPSERADFGARYFTPAEEIPMAGHPTVATIFALVESGAIKVRSKSHKVTLELKAGVLDVDIEKSADSSTRIVMTQLKPQFLDEHRAVDVAPLFGLAAADVVSSAPVQTVSTGTPQLMVLVKDLDCLRQASLNISAYADYKKKSGFFGAHLFCLEGATPAGDTFARHFVTPPDLIEDPFTGSATGGMAAYLWRYGLIESPTFVAEQGHFMRRPGHAYVEVLGQPEDIDGIRVGGEAVTVLNGELLLP